MIKLSDIYEELITEAVDRNILINAIQQKKLLTIYYDSPHGDQPDGKGWRRIEPFCYGINKFDNAVLRAWQIHGPSDSYPPGKAHDPLTAVPGWRMFRIDGITQINETGNDRFTAPRPKYNPDDKDMKIIYAAADFGNNNTNTQQPVEPTAPAPVATPSTSPAAPLPSTGLSVPSTSAPLPPATPTSTTSPFSSNNTAQDYGDSDGVTDVDNFLNPNINKDMSGDDVDNLETPDSDTTQDPQTSKPSWFTKFGDKFKNIVNFGKGEKNKI